MKKTKLSLSISAYFVTTVMIILTSFTMFATPSPVCAQSLPASLNAFYPPKVPQPVYLFKMFEIGTPFSAIVADLTENDFENVMANYEKFKTKYVEVSKLVPEWEKEFPLEPVNKLGTALKSGDQGKVMAAFENVGKICQDCHVTKMTNVQFNYHWKDFKSITVEDPLSKENVDFVRLMQFIDANFTGTMVDVEQGQKENAQKQFQGFRARFEAMKETCMNCHDTERKYYVDESIQNMIEKLDQSLQAASIDPKEVEKYSMGIGMESCIKCHWVHIPAAYAHRQWEK